MITVPEAARLVGRDPETIRRWIRAGKLTAWKIGTQHVIDEDDLTNVVRGGIAAPTAETRTHTELSTSQIVAAVHRSRAERSAQVREVSAPYLSEPEASRSVVLEGDLWLPAIVGRIVRIADPARIVLFGSRARKTARDDSDYDLLVVVDEVSNRRETRIGIRRGLADLPISIDIVVSTADEIAGSHGRPRGVVHWALAEGRTIYGRP